MQRVATTLVLLVFAATSSDASAATRSGKKRWIGCVVGTGAGFFAGLVVGLHYFDDAIYSNSKVLGTTLGFTAAGGTAGFLLGRKWDKPSPSREPALPLRPEPRWSRPLPAPLSPAQGVSSRSRDAELAPGDPVTVEEFQSLADRLREVMCPQHTRLSCPDLGNCAHAHVGTDAGIVSGVKIPLQ